jgi:hypothetical protein
MKVLLKFVYVLIAMHLCSNAYAQQEKQLLSDAISQFSSITPELPTKDRLRLYEIGLEKINRITNEYGSTDTGLILKSTGKFGDFDIKRIQQTYTDELTSYYGTVCQVSPSAACQGFVALQEGIKQCKVGRSFNELSNAHTNLLNAIFIFKEVAKNETHYSLTKNIYLQCNKNTRDIDPDVSKNYFYYQLVKNLIPLGDITFAKGLIEQISNPYYKFSSVIDLKKLGSEPIDSEYLNRLQQYIDEKINRNSNLGRISVLALGNLALEPKSNAVIDWATLRSFSHFSGTYKPAGVPAYMQRPTSSCDVILSKETFDVANIFLESLYKIPVGGRIKFNSSQKNSYFGGFIDAKPSEKIPLFEGCPQQYTIALASISYLYAYNKPKEAAKYYKEFTKGNFSTDKLKVIDLYMELASDTEVAKLHPSMNGVEGSFATFKKMVDFENICDASKLMFTRLKQSPYFSESQAYLASKRTLANASKYRCGNEDLEILLK